MVVFEFKAIWESRTIYESALLLCQWGSSPSTYCDINGHSWDRELDIFMVEILVYSILKWIQALLARLSDNRELKSAFHHFCLSIAISDTLFSWETQIFSLAKRRLMLVLLSSTTSEPNLRKRGPKPLLAQENTTLVMSWSTGHGVTITVTQQNY